MLRSSPTRALAIVLVALVVLVAVAIRWLDRSASEPLPALDGAAESGGVDRDAARAALAKVPERAVGGDPLGGIDAGAAWVNVDMEAVRRALPESLYWDMAAPTQDPEVIEARAKDRARWNEEYGKVLSNTATAEEVDAYYAHQQLVSSDYLEFVVHILTNYGDVIPPRDAGLLKLAGEMHLARLEEIPRKIAEAHERREAHEQARREWLAEQEAFASDGDAPR